MKKIKVGIIQIELITNAKANVLAKIENYIAECAKNQCGLVCLPEAFATSINLMDLENDSEPIPGDTSRFLCQLAQNYNLYLAAGLIEKDKGAFFSTSLLISNEGIILHKYRRVHVYTLEQRFLSGSNIGSTVIDIPLARIGLISGYDINFPEACRDLFNQNVEIIICPSCLPALFAKSNQYLAVTRAIENNCYFILANGAGENIPARIQYMGRSMIVRNPVALDRFSLDYIETTEIIAQAGDKEEIIYADLDLNQIRREHEESPFLKDAKYSVSLEVKNG